MAAVIQYFISWSNTVFCYKPRVGSVVLYNKPTSLVFTLFSLCILIISNLSSVLYFPASTNVNGTVWTNCVDVPLRIYSLTYSQTITVKKYTKLSLAA